MGERVKEEDIRERTNEVENRVQDTRTMVYLPGQTARRRPPTKPADRSAWDTHSSIHTHFYERSPRTLPLGPFPRTNRSEVF